MKAQGSEFTVQDAAALPGAGKRGIACRQGRGHGSESHGIAHAARAGTWF